jgi:phenylalanyl-tRNA synthetase beta chain
MAAYGQSENFYVMKGRVEELLRNFGIRNFEFVTQKDDPSYHPGRCADIFAGDKYIGTIGQVHPDGCENYGVECEVYAAELEFRDICAMADHELIFKPLPKFPAMTRDFAMVVKEEVKVGDLEKEIRSSAGPLLENVKLFDVYRGVPILPGFKSVAFNLAYRAADRTLTENEVNDINTKVLTNLKDKYNATLREM